MEFGSRSILALSPDPDEWGYIQVIGDGDSDSDSESNLGVEDHLDVDPARRRSMYQKSDHKKDIDELMKLRSGLRFAREYRHSNVGERQGRRARGENKEVSKKSALVPTPRKPVQRHVQYTYAPHVNANLRIILLSLGIYSMYACPCTWAGGRWEIGKSGNRIRQPGDCTNEAPEIWDPKKHGECGARYRRWRESASYGR